ncbi:MAG: SBBP repeat-containing protein [bacterium]
MRVDNSGNAYITGYSVGSGTGKDYTTIKYNTNGDSLWVQRYNVGNDIAESLTIDSLSNVYITGYSAGDYATIKYSSAGNLEWLQRYDAYSNDHAYGIAVDNLRNVYVTGFVQNGGFPGDFYTIRYSQTLLTKTLLEGFYNPVTNMTRDTARAYLRSVNSPFNIVDSANQYLDTSGTGYYSFYNALYGQYYIQIKHRNSIETWSTAIYPFNTMTYDFTTAASQAYGNNQILKGTKYCIYSGDVNQDGVVDLVDLAIVDDAAFNGDGGYIQPDVNGDFFVDLSDLAIVDNNASNFVSKVIP